MTPVMSHRRDELAGCLSATSTCSGFLACLAAHGDYGAASTTDLRECAVAFAPDDLAGHDGRQYTRVASVVSTQKAPIERCGVGDANRWLATLACNDGSHPIASPADAERQHPGMVGYGGRCDAEIDVYQLSCPDGATDIFIDEDACPKPPKP